VSDEKLWDESPTSRHVQKHVELHNIYQEKLHVEASCFHRIL